MEIALPSAVGLILMSVSEKEAPRTAKVLGWSLPAFLVVVPNLGLWRTVEALLAIKCAFFLLAATYLVMGIVRHNNPAAVPLSEQLLAALVLFLLVTQAAGFTGDVDGIVQKSARPSIRLLLAPKLVPAATKLGVTFSTPSQPGLTDPLNVVVVSEKTYYVWIPVTDLSGKQSHDGVALQWGNGTMAIPRDKVLLGRASLQ